MNLLRLLTLGIGILATLLNARLSTSAATILWTNTTGGSWNTTNNWSPNQVPIAGDIAIITNSGNYTVTIASGASAGFIQLGSSSGTQTLDWSAATISSALTVFSNGVVRWLGGSLTSPLTVQAGGRLSLEGSATKQILNSGVVTNAGLVTWTNTGDWFLYDSVVRLVNLTGGVVDFQNDKVLQVSSGAPVIHNAGVWRKSAASGISSIQPSFQNTGTVEVQSGTLTFAGGGTLGGVYAAAPGASVQIASAVTYSGVPPLNLTAVQLVTSGTLTANGPITNLTLNGGTLAGTSILSGLVNWNAGTLSGALTLASNAVMRWQGGNLTGPLTVQASGWLSLEGTAAKQILNSGVLTNAGLVSWTNTGDWFLYSSVVRLVNLASGVMELQNDEALQVSGGAAVVYNAGLWRKSTGSGTNIIQPNFQNTGTVELQSGAFNFTGGGTIDGSYAVSTGTTLQFGNGSWTLGDATEFSGAGNVWITAGTVAYSGVTALDLARVQVMSGGTLTANGPITNLTLNGGTLTGTGALSGLVNWTAGTVGGALSLTGNGTMRWQGGNLTGALTVQAGSWLSLEGSTLKQILNSGVLTNAGLVTWTNTGDWNLVSTVVRLVNQAGGVVDLQNDKVLQVTSGTAVIQNAGLWRKSAAGGTSTIQGNFQNTGAVEVQNGILIFAGGGTLGGVYAATPGASVQIASAVTYSGVTTLNLAAAQVITAGTLTANGPITNITLNGGTLAGTNTLSGTVDWIAGTVSGPLKLTSNAVMRWQAGNLTGPLTIQPGGWLSLEGTASKQILNSGVLTNAGLVTWSDTGDWTLYAAVVRLVNLGGGVVELQNDKILQTINGTVLIQNAGLWRKSAGNGMSTIQPSFQNTGTVEVRSGTLSFANAYSQTAGLTTLRGGNITMTMPFQLLGGALTGTNTFTGNVTNSSVVSPGVSPGLLTIAGHYTQTTNGSLLIELAGTSPGAGYDRLAVTGTANLAGTLVVTLTNNFTPAPNALFSILTAAVRANTFNTFSYPSNVLTMQTVYTSTNAAVQIAGNPPNNVTLTPVAFTNGQFVIRVAGNVGPDYTLQATTNFANWINLTTNNPPTTPFVIVDPSAGIFSKRFYRVLATP